MGAAQVKYTKTLNTVIGYHVHRGFKPKSLEERNIDELKQNISSLNRALIIQGAMGFGAIVVLVGVMISNGKNIKNNTSAISSNMSVIANNTPAISNNTSAISSVVSALEYM
jgi:hypothetical protein